MKWGVISDTHDKVDQTKAAISIFEAQGCDHVLHCGDFDSDHIYKLFQKKSFHFLYVTDHASHDARMKHRCDHLETRIGAYKVAMYHNTYQTVELDGRSFSVRENILSKRYDLVLYGHLHYFNIKLPTRTNKTLAMTPGGFYYPELSTFCILDMDMETVELYYWVNGGFELIFRIAMYGVIQDMKAVDKVMAKRFVDALKALRWNSKDRWEYAFTNDEDEAWLCKNYELLYGLVGVTNKPAFFY